jgi:secreted trypsin-like serine protease
MAATVINSYSAELTQIQPPLYAPLPPNKQHGRIRVAYFTKVFATEAAGEDVALVTIPKGARLLSGQITVSATTGTATLSVGLMGKDGTGFIDAAGSVSDDVAACLAAAAITTTPKVPFLQTQALKYGYETEKELYLTLTTAVAAMAAQTITGHLEYAVD